MFLSCSLDKTIKVWVANESRNLEVTYTHQEESGVLTLCGVHDSEAKPVLLCSCSDASMICLPFRRGGEYSLSRLSGALRLVLVVYFLPVMNQVRLESGSG